MKYLPLIALFLITTLGAYAQKTDLSLNLQLGQIYMQHTTAKLQITQTIMGEKIELPTTITGKMTYKPVEIKDGIYKLETVYESLGIDMKGMQQLTGSSEDTSEGNLFSRMLRNMKGRSFFVYINKKGIVQKTENIESIWRNVFHGIDQLSDEQKMALTSVIKDTYGEKALKGSFESVMAFYPDHKVAVSDKWSKQTHMSAGYEATLTKTYELTAINDKYSTIKGTGEIKTLDNNATVAINGMSVKYNLKGTTQSETKIDSKSGWVIETTIKQAITGEMIIAPNEQFPTGITIPMEIISDVILN